MSRRTAFAFAVGVQLTLCVVGSSNASADPHSALSAEATSRALAGHYLVSDHFYLPGQTTPQSTGVIGFVEDGHAFSCSMLAEDGEKPVIKTGLKWAAVADDYYGSLLVLEDRTGNKVYSTPLTISPDTSEAFSWAWKRLGEWRMVNQGIIARSIPSKINQMCGKIFSASGMPLTGKIMPGTIAGLAHQVVPAKLTEILTDKDIVNPAALINDNARAMAILRQNDGIMQKVSKDLFAIIDVATNQVWVSFDADTIADQTTLQIDPRTQELQMRWTARKTSETFGSLVEAFHVFYAPTGIQHHIWLFRNWLMQTGHPVRKRKVDGVSAHYVVGPGQAVTDTETGAVGNWAIDFNNILFNFPDAQPVSVPWKSLASQLDWTAPEKEIANNDQN